MDECERRRAAYDIVYIDPDYIHVLQEDLQQDLDTFKESISRGLKDAPMSVIDKEDLMLIFCTKVAKGIRQASTRLQQDRDFILKLVNSKPRALEFIDPKFQDDEEVVTMAIGSKGSTLAYASPRLRESREMVILAIENGLDIIPPSLSMDRDLFKIYVKYKDDALLQADESLRKDKDFILEILAINSKAKHT